MTTKTISTSQAVQKWLLTPARRRLCHSLIAFEQPCANHGDEECHDDDGSRMIVAKAQDPENDGPKHYEPHPIRYFPRKSDDGAHQSLHSPLNRTGLKLGIAHGVPDVLVAEVGLDRPGIGPVIGKLVAAGMAQHVGMHLEAELCLIAQPLDHLLKAIDRKWGYALGHEKVR